jgi:hypothetical protein
MHGCISDVHDMRSVHQKKLHTFAAPTCTEVHTSWADMLLFIEHRPSRMKLVRMLSVLAFSGGVATCKCATRHWCVCLSVVYLYTNVYLTSAAWYSRPAVSAMCRVGSKPIKACMFLLDCVREGCSPCYRARVRRSELLASNQVYTPCTPVVMARSLWACMTAG